MPRTSSRTTACSSRAGSDIAFTELRLLASDGTVVACASATPSAGEPMRLCGGRGTTTSYGPLRVSLILSTQKRMGDVINYPERYRAEVLVRGVWQAADLINVCHAQE